MEKKFKGGLMARLEQGINMPWVQIQERLVWQSRRILRAFSVAGYGWMRK
jgi:hypothetical protein